MQDKILITGGSGFIGNNLCKFISNSGFSTIGTTTNLTNKNNSVNFEWTRWDSNEDKEIYINWKEVKAIVHAAAPYDLTNFPKNSQSIVDVFIEGTHYLLNKCIEYGIKNFNLISTGDVINHNKLIYKSDLSYNPSNFYTTVKSSAEIITKSFSNLINTKIIRLFHPYGPGGDRFLVNRLINRIAKNKTVYVEGNNGIIVNPIWIYDVVSGLDKCINHNSSDIFHLGGAEKIDINNLLYKIGNHLKVEPIIKFLDESENKNHVGEIGKTCNKLNWENKINLDSGIKLYIESELN
jgi:nucleoside-diphosphate-sugar epimerase